TPTASVGLCLFFSSRRRHTTSKRDWSSDVCSSDLPPRDRSELVEVLRAAHEHALLDTDALWMIQGVLSTSELQVGDIMVPRSQKIGRASCRERGETQRSAVSLQ